MNVFDFIRSMPADRHAMLSSIHNIIITNDPTVSAVVKPMMGKEMILYEERGYMKYGLASAKNYMSLHCLPIYMVPSLHAKYAGLMPEAKVQKGCINFTGAAEMPAAIVEALIVECSDVSIATILENRKKK